MSWLLAAAAGAAAGVLSGFGVGGGTLLLLWLTLVQGMDQFRAGGINLLYFASCALPALWGHVRRGLVERQAALWAILTGLPACVGAALLAAQLDVTLLRRVFGLFLLAVGLRELFSKPEKGSGGKPRIISQKGRTLLPRPNPAAAPGNPHKRGSHNEYFRQDRPGPGGHWRH